MSSHDQGEIFSLIKKKKDQENVVRKVRGDFERRFNRNDFRQKDTSNSTATKFYGLAQTGLVASSYHDNVADSSPPRKKRPINSSDDDRRASSVERRLIGTRISVRNDRYFPFSKESKDRSQSSENEKQIQNDEKNIKEISDDKTTQNLSRKRKRKSDVKSETDDERQNDQRPRIHPLQRTPASRSRPMTSNWRDRERNRRKREDGDDRNTEEHLQQNDENVFHQRLIDKRNINNEEQRDKKVDRCTFSPTHNTPSTALKRHNRDDDRSESDHENRDHSPSDRRRQSRVKDRSEEHEMKENNEEIMVESQPRLFRKQSKDDVARNKRMFGNLICHIGAAKKELKDTRLRYKKGVFQRKLDELMHMEGNELRDELEEANEPISGNLDDLRRRLRRCLENRVKAATTSEQTRARRAVERRVHETLTIETQNERNKAKRRAQRKSLRLIKQKDFELKSIDWKIKARAQEAEIRELEQQARLKSAFLITKVGPPIQYCPAKHTEKTRPLLEESKSFHESILKEQITSIRSHEDQEPVLSELEFDSDEEREKIIWEKQRRIAEKRKKLEEKQFEELSKHKIDLKEQTEKEKAVSETLFNSATIGGARIQDVARILKNQNGEINHDNQTDSRRRRSNADDDAGRHRHSDRNMSRRDRSRHSETRRHSREISSDRRNNDREIDRSSRRDERNRQSVRNKVDDRRWPRGEVTGEKDDSDEDMDDNQESKSPDKIQENGDLNEQETITNPTKKRNYPMNSSPQSPTTNTSNTSKSIKSHDGSMPSSSNRKDTFDEKESD